MNFKSAVVYWIHLPEHVDYLTEGYLGVITDFNIRMKNHITDINKNKHKNPHLVNAVKKYGWDNLVKEIVLSGEEAYCYEIEEDMRPNKAIGWNVAPGGHRGPGWTKGRKKSALSVEKQKRSAELTNDIKRKEKNRLRQLRLQERETKRLLKKQELDKKLVIKEQKKIEKQKIIDRRNIERDRRRKKQIEEGTYGIIHNYFNRPICKECNKNRSAINYTRKNKTYCRSICDECGRKKKKKKPFKPSWQKSGYKKKSTCDLCGFKSLFPSQLTVFHIDGNLENTQLTNLRSICLNCVEVVKRKEVTWKRGDLEVDY